jgi:hypothetical protein
MVSEEISAAARFSSCLYAENGRSSFNERRRSGQHGYLKPRSAKNLSGVPEPPAPFRNNREAAPEEHKRRRLGCGRATAASTADSRGGDIHRFYRAQVAIGVLKLNIN